MKIICSAYNKLRALWVLILHLLLSFSGKAQYIDEINFGNTDSELSHGLTSYNVKGSEAYTGQAGLMARHFLPDSANPFCGIYTGTYGGEVTFVMRVNGNEQNYFTGKFSGDETSRGRILLILDGKEVGSRHGGNEEFFEGMEGPVIPGTFYFRTMPLPRTLTDGKTEVTIRLRSTGRYYAYGKPFVYLTYQKVLDSTTRGIYAAFTHIDPGFTLLPSDLIGVTPVYASAPANSSPDLLSLYNSQIEALNNKIINILKAGNTIGQNAAWNLLEFLAMCYERPEIKSAYHNKAVVDKICNVIDQFVSNDYLGKTNANGDWGGYYGRSGNAVALMGKNIPDNFLDQIVDLGGGKVTRRSEWARIFKASFEFGAANRRSISNQDLFASLSVFGAALALKRLVPDYPTYAEVGYHHVLESCGIEPFTGNAVISNGVAKTGAPENSFTGSDYYFTTLKGTTHEPGWVSPDCYGNQGNAFVEIYQMTKCYLGGNGEMRALAVAIKHSKTQATFTYAWTVNGSRAILAEGFDCVRNTYVPGKPFYGSEQVAGATNDAVLMGFMKQMFEDGQLGIEKNPHTMSIVYYLDLFKNLINNTYNARLPSSPDQPDYFYADEENGLVTIKNGAERLTINMFYRTGQNNRLAKAHHITANSERFIEFRPEYTAYRTNGKFVSRGKSVLTYSGEAPDAPVSAYAGQNDTIPLGQRGIVDLYHVRYNNYFIAMNTTRPGFDETVQFPNDLIGKRAYCMHDHKTIIIPAKMTIKPLTTYIFKIEDAVSNNSGLIVSKIIPADKKAIKAKVEKMELFAQTPGTVANVGVIPTNGFYQYEYFNAFMRALSKAKYMANNTAVSQEQVNLSLNQLNESYDDLQKNKYVVNK